MVMSLKYPRVIAIAYYFQQPSLCLIFESIMYLYLVVYQIAVMVLSAVSNVRFFTLVLLYIQIGTRATTFWCGSFNNYLCNIDLKFGLLLLLYHQIYYHQ